MLALKQLCLHNHNYALLKDEELVYYAQFGDSKATNELYHRYIKFLSIISKNYFLTGSSEEDVLQEFYIGFFKAIRDFKDEYTNSFRTFMIVCVKRHIISAIRTSNRQKHVFINTATSLDKNVNLDSEPLMNFVIDDLNSSPESQYLKKEYFSELTKALEFHLTPFELTAFKLVMSGLNHIESARIMGINSKGVQNAMYRIRKKLRRIYC